MPKVPYDPRGPVKSHPLYKRWKNMHYRDYECHGICQRWLRQPKDMRASSEAFWRFVDDMGLPPSSSHTLDRIDNDKGYSPGNCRWATRKTQARNRSNTIYLTHNGVTKSMPEWAEDLGIPYSRLKQRIYHEWPVHRALAN